MTRPRKHPYLTPTQFRAKYPQIPAHELLPTGALLVKMIDQANCQITPEEREQVLNLNTPEQVREYLTAQTINLGPLKAKNDFAKFIARLDVPASLVIYHFDSLAACQRAIGYTEDALKAGGEAMAAQDKIELLNTMILGIHAQGELIKNAAALVRSLFNQEPVQKAKHDVPEAAPAEKRPQPKNLAPDILADEPHLNGVIDQA